MNQTQPKPKKVVNTLSVRLPPELYNQIAEIALERCETLNSIFIEMVRSGLDRKLDEARIIEDFIFSHVSQERMKELMNGKSQSITRITT